MPAAVAIPLATAGGAALGNIAAAKVGSNAAKDGARIQDAATQRAEAFQRQQAQNEWQNAEAARRANYDQWRARQSSIAGLAGQYGVNVDIPDYEPGVDPRYDPSGTPPPSANNGGSGTGSAADLQALLKSGVDPQQAIAQFNTQYGRSTGNEAVYYPPSAHGGVATIGLPDAYLSLEPTGWGITQRSGAGASRPAARGSIAAMTAPTPQAPAVTVPIPTPYQPGTIARRRA